MNTKQYILLALWLAFIGGAGYVWLSAHPFVNWRNITQAAGGMPWQDAGKITLVRAPCILDTPPGCPVGVPCTACGISCPQVSAVYGPACVSYIEVDVQSQQGTTFLAVPVGFQYKGGGTYPQAGMSYIAGGSSNIQPWVIGIPKAP